VKNKKLKNPKLLISDLPIAEKAKRVIEIFLEEEFIPSNNSDPQRDKKIKKRIIKHICFASQEIAAYNGFDKIPTLFFSYQLSKLAEYSHPAIGIKLDALAELLKSTVRSRRKK